MWDVESNLSELQLCVCVHDFCLSMHPASDYILVAPLWGHRLPHSVLLQDESNGVFYSPEFGGNDPRCCDLRQGHQQSGSCV